jgi:hypothetical protein
MALITGIIPSQNFELIRDRIGAILSLELGNQYQLSNPKNEAINIKQVWVERCTVFDGNIELPTINVGVDHGVYGNGNMFKTDGTYCYNIDIYTNAPSSQTTGPGDQYAMKNMSKIAGMVRYILSNPAYKTLGFDPGIVNGIKVDKFYITDRKQVPDALQDVIGRIEFTVKCIETVDTFQNGADLTLVTTKTLLEDPTYGFYYQFQH